MAASDTLINTLFDGRYRIMRKLGTGGMANVYLAQDEELGRLVAIKVLNDRYAGDEAFVARFRNEAKSAAALSHRNIVAIYDRGESDGHPYIAMEVIEGRSLKELIQARGPLPIGRALDYAQQILAAVRFAHRNGIVHRDIKPHNILIDADDHLKVTDFGIARLGTSEMTETGSIMGTAQYLSPEQARGTAVDARSDLYSVGIVLYEMLTGRVPFNGDSPIEVAMKHVNDQPARPSEAIPGLPVELDEVVLRSLAKSPAARYQTADEFADDVRRVQAGQPVAPETSEAATALLAGAAATQVLSRPPSTTPPAPPATGQPPRRPPGQPPPGYGYSRDRPRRRKRTIFPWLLVIGLLAAAAVAGWYVYTQIQDQLQESKPVAVPYVVGIGEKSAVTKIEDAGLRAEVESEPSRDQPPGKVFRQEPEAGVRLAKDERVTIFVSTGVPEVAVPRLAGLTYEQAQQELERVNLVAQRKNVFSTAEPGTVVSQDPKPAAQAEEGTTVLVRVSKGEQTFGVPDVLAQSQESATAELEEAGFAVDAVVVPSEESAGLVVAQSPDPGAQASKGSTVVISVSEGPQIVTATVPDVTGFDRASAEVELQAAGFSTNVQEEQTPDANQDGLVLGQDPAGGSEAEQGTTVTIVVGVLVETPPPDATG
jgi:beta-lactam-binding protein with PASTA domain